MGPRPLEHRSPPPHPRRHLRRRRLPGPRRRVMATFRNFAIGTLKTAGHPNIAAATRSHARDATRTIATLGLTRP